MIYILNNGQPYDSNDVLFVESDADAGDLRVLFTPIEGIGRTIFLGMAPVVAWEDAGPVITAREWVERWDGFGSYDHSHGCPGHERVIDCNCPSRPRVDAAIRLGLVKP
jgi:hypothetical protein